MKTVVTAINSATWTQVADGSGEATTVLQSQGGSVYIFVGDAAPTNNANTFNLKQDLTLPGTATVWAKGSGQISAIIV